MRVGCGDRNYTPNFVKINKHKMKTLARWFHQKECHSLSSPKGWSRHISIVFNKIRTTRAITNYKTRGIRWLLRFSFFIFYFICFVCFFASGLQSGSFCRVTTLPPRALLYLDSFVSRHDLHFWKVPLLFHVVRVRPRFSRPPSSATANFRIVSEIHVSFFWPANGFGDAVRKRQGPEKRSSAASESARYYCESIFS